MRSFYLNDLFTTAFSILNFFLTLPLQQNAKVDTNTRKNTQSFLCFPGLIQIAELFYCHW